MLVSSAFIFSQRPGDDYLQHAGILVALISDRARVQACS